MPPKQYLHEVILGNDISRLITVVPAVLSGGWFDLRIIHQRQSFSFLKFLHVGLCAGLCAYLSELWQPSQLIVGLSHSFARSAWHLHDTPTSVNFCSKVLACMYWPLQLSVRIVATIRTHCWPIAFLCTQRLALGTARHIFGNKIMIKT